MRDSVQRWSSQHSYIQIRIRQPFYRIFHIIYRSENNFSIQAIRQSADQLAFDR